VEHLAVELYRRRFGYREETMLAQYFELRGLFLERYAELNLKEQKVHLMSLLNDTTKLYRANLVEVSEFLSIYKLGLKTKIILNQKILDRISFRIIVAASNYTKSFNYTNQFIKTYSGNLKKEFQTDGYYWALAHTEYWKKNLEKSLDILINNDVKSSYFKLQCKVLTTQVYFDLYIENDSYQDFLFNYFDSFEKWIYREKFASEKFKKGFLNFIQIIRKLAKLYSNVNFQEEKLNDLLEGKKNIQGSKWISQRIRKVIKLKKGDRS